MSCAKLLHKPAGVWDSAFYHRETEAGITAGIERPQASWLQPLPRPYCGHCTPGPLLQTEPRSPGSSVVPKPLALSCPGHISGQTQVSWLLPTPSPKTHPLEPRLPAASHPRQLRWEIWLSHRQALPPKASPRDPELAVMHGGDHTGHQVHGHCECPRAEVRYVYARDITCTGGMQNMSVGDAHTRHAYEA